MISKLFRMECLSDGVSSSLAILTALKKDLGRAKAQPAATRIPEAGHHLENVVSVIEKASFWTCFGNLKGGVRETISLEPIYS